MWGEVKQQAVRRGGALFQAEQLVWRSGAGHDVEEENDARYRSYAVS